MTQRLEPVPGQWYVNLDTEQLLQVLDAADGSIDIQSQGGDLEEVTLEEWNGLRLECCEQPEDWVGSFDDLEADDIGLPEAGSPRPGSRDPLG